MSQGEKIDALIAKIAREDDPVAFRDFFDLYYGRLIKLAYYYTGSRYDAEEIVSSVFIGIWNNRIKLPKIKRIEAYLFTAVKNRYFNFIRDNKKGHHLSLDVLKEEFQVEFNNPNALLLEKELRNKILEVINGLPPRCRLIFELVKDSGLKYREVADLLDISVKAVEAQVSKAMRILKKELYTYSQDMDADRYPARKSRNSRFFFL